MSGPDGSGPDDAASGPLEQAGTVHLARFNVFEVEDVERAIATHLGVSLEHVAPEGFVVVPEDAGRLLVTWESSAAIDIVEFQAIVGATAANQRSVPRVVLPEPHGPMARPRRKVPRESRRRQVDETG